MQHEYEHASLAANRFVRVMTLINAALTVSVLGLWAYLAPYLNEPLSAALKMPLPNGSRLDVLNPSFAILWLPPLIAIMLANFSLNAQCYRLSRWVAAFPAVMLIFVMIWYYGFSATYR